MGKLPCVVILVALYTISFSEAFSSCQVGWYLSATSGTCIKQFSDKTKTWSEARSACKQETKNTGDLIAIRDEATNNLVSDIITSTGQPYWIGLHDQRHEGQWEWLDDEFQATVYFWDDNQPNNMDPDSKQDQDCVEIGLMSTDKWNDLDCNMKVGYICEQPAGSGYEVPCPTGWTGSPSTGTCLKVYNSNYNWQESRGECQKGNGDLIKITDGSQSKIVEGLVKAAGMGVWIGLHDENREGRFQWLDDRSRRLTYTNWDDGQPNNIDDQGASTDQDCVEIGVLSKFKWNDYDCLNDLGRICENPPSVSDKPLYCDAGWTQSPTTGTCLQMNYQTTETWEGARSQCKSRGADLVRIVDPFQDSLIVGLIKAHTGGYWIGLHDKGHEGSFTWLDDMRTPDYQDWGRGQPNNMDEKGENTDQNCVEIGVGAGDNWNDISCNSNLFYICEKPSTDVNGVPVTAKPIAYGSSSAGSGLSGGATAGIIILVLVLVGVLIGAGWYGYRRYTGAPVGMPESFSNKMFKFGGGGAEGGSSA